MKIRTSAFLLRAGSLLLPALISFFLLPGSFLKITLVTASAVAFDFWRLQGRTISRFAPLLIATLCLQALIALLPSSSPEPGNFSLVLDEHFGRVNWRDEFPPMVEGAPNPPVETVSVIFTAHGEHAYIEKTIKSIYDETPGNFLKEIILVDDASSPPLVEIVGEKFPGVKIIRHEVQQGLIRSKTHGAAVAEGDVIMFLDAHIKAEKDWLPPIFREISENYKRVVVPVIPILDEATWSWLPGSGVGIKMMFDWALQFDWFEDGNDLVPVMSGGLLGIHRRWWFESGQYDTGMALYGAENIEQSIRVWLCGGEIKVARDSRVSHLFRPKFPYAINDTLVMINKVRMVEVWFDEFKTKVYEATPALRDLIPFTGDLVPRFQLREDLKCGKFRDYVDKFGNVFIRKGLLPTPKFLIKDEKSGKCLTAENDGLILEDCKAGNAQQQFWIEGPQLKQGPYLCLDANANAAEKEKFPVLLFHCHDFSNKNQHWTISKGRIKWHEWCGNFFEENLLRMGKCEGSPIPQSFVTQVLS